MGSRKKMKRTRIMLKGEILIIDDEEINLLVLEELLGVIGFRNLTCGKTL